MSSQPNIELRTAATPNGQKISIHLSELGIPYTVTAIDLGKSEQKTSSFLKVNPNGRIPAIVDHSRNAFPVFESGAIFLYLCEHYDPSFRFHFQDPDEKSEMLQWLFFQNAGLGPMQGQANHFFRYAPEKIEYGIRRYQNETKRLYAVLEERLSGGGGGGGEEKREYLVGKGTGKYSVADISTFTWVRWAAWAGIEIDEFPHLKDWMQRIERRDKVQEGLKVPDEEDQIVRLRRDPGAGDPFKEWVMQGQKEVAEKHGK